MIAQIIQNCLFSIISPNYILIHKTGFAEPVTHIYIYKHTSNPWESNHRDGPTGHNKIEKHLLTLAISAVL